jgi:hypothetical protein
MTDTSEVTSPEPQDSPAGTRPEPPAPRKLLNNSWVLTVAACCFATYYLVSGALILREKHGNGVFALVMTGIVAVVGVISVLLFKQFRAERK